MLDSSPHHTSHFFTGFILEPRAHWKSLANSCISPGEAQDRGQRSVVRVTWLFEKGPWTLNIPGEWTPVLILFSRALSRYLEHQVLAALIQNIWTWQVVKERFYVNFSFDSSWLAVCTSLKDWLLLPVQSVLLSNQSNLSFLTMYNILCRVTI